MSAQNKDQIRKKIGKTIFCHLREKFLGLLLEANFPVLCSVLQYTSIPPIKFHVGECRNYSRVRIHGQSC